MTREQFKQICEWQAQTFGSATPLSKLAHLKEELKELKYELEVMDIMVANKRSQKLIKAHKTVTNMEFADCFFLLFGAANAAGMSYDDICNAIQSKFEINKQRKWGKPDANGVVKHI